MDKEDLVSTLQTRWDWENDGIFDADYSTNKILNHQFTEVGTYQITLEVKDTKNLSNSMTKSLVVTAGQLPSVITDSVTYFTSVSASCRLVLAV